MHARSLARRLRQIAAGVAPVATIAAVTYLHAGCCGDYHRRELRPLTTLPAGWEHRGNYLWDGSDAYYGSPGDPGIAEDDCTVICGGPAECEFVLQCDSPSGAEVDAGETTGGELGCDPENSSRPYAFWVVCETAYGATCGRRPAGLARRGRATGEGPLGAYLAELAWLEAASVEAFDVLDRELAAHGAPARLRAAARRARRDEVRHARIMSALARRHGGSVERPIPRRDPAPRSLVDLALENAREGCVRETYGALTAIWQAERAGDPRLRAAFAAIAADEARHAALSWRIAAWAEARLDRGDRRVVAEARTRAAKELLDDARREPPGEIVEAAGVPTTRVALELVRGLEEALLARAAA